MERKTNWSLSQKGRNDEKGLGWRLSLSMKRKKCRHVSKVQSIRKPNGLDLESIVATLT